MLKRINVIDVMLLKVKCNVNVRLWKSNDIIDVKLLNLILLKSNNVDVILLKSINIIDVILLNVILLKSNNVKCNISVKEH